MSSLSSADFSIGVGARGYSSEVQDNVVLLFLGERKCKGLKRGREQLENVKKGTAKLLRRKNKKGKLN